MDESTVDLICREHLVLMSSYKFSVLQIIRVGIKFNISLFTTGDHSYKRVDELPPEEQMISPLPDIKVLEIDPDVEFMILACDGIWNFMSSQEVLEFVRERLQKSPAKISQVCEEVILILPTLIQIYEEKFHHNFYILVI